MKPNILDALSAVGIVGGSVASLVSQQVAFAAIPLSCSVALSVINRRSLLKEMADNQQVAIATLHQNSQNSHQYLAGQITQFQEKVAGDHQAQQTKLDQLFAQLQQLTSDFTKETQALQASTQNLDYQQQQLEKIVSTLKDIENCSQALRSNPNSAQFYYQRGVSHQFLGDRQGAVEDYNQALALNPSYAQAYHKRGLVKAEIGNRKAAIEDLRKASKFYFQQGDLDSYQKAKDFYMELHELPSHTLDETTEKLLSDSLFSAN